MINNLSQVIVKPRLTEKGSRLQSIGQYVFDVHVSADKFLVKKSIEATYNVKVLSVNVLNQIGKAKRSGAIIGKRSDWKKAYITLVPGYSIDIQTDSTKG